MSILGANVISKGHLEPSFVECEDPLKLLRTVINIPSHYRLT